MKLTREEIEKVIDLALDDACLNNMDDDKTVKTIASALLSHFDLTEKGKVEKMEKVVEAARIIVEFCDRPCRLDHEGYCQTHFLDNPCIVAKTQQALAELDRKTTLEPPSAGKMAWEESNNLEREEPK